MQVSSIFKEVEVSNSKALKKIYNYKKIQIEEEDREADDIIK